MPTIGPQLFAKEADGRYVSTIASLFPRHKLLITSPPIHTFQRVAFMDWFPGQQAASGLPAPSRQRLAWEAKESVDLILAPGDVIQIRPELERLDLAFEADQQLQDGWEVPLHRIRFLSVRDLRVRQALRERGELWRMSAAPSGPDQISAAVAHSRVAIAERDLYYYNPHTGTRFVTCASFANLATLDDVALARQLSEIAEHCLKRNRHGHPEVAFFGVDVLRFGAPNFVGVSFAELDPQALRNQHAALTSRFREATEPGLREDDPEANGWRLRMFAAIASEPSEGMLPGPLQGLSSEFSPRIRWLPGGRFEEGEFVFASIFPRESGQPEDPELKALWDPLARGFIANFIREYGNIEYLNLGRIEAAQEVHPTHGGRRGVHLAEIKVRGEAHPRVLFLRLLRWGIHERLDEEDDRGQLKGLERTVLETEEYVDYTMDRRLGCLQLGLHLPPRVNMRRVSEPYVGRQEKYRDRFFPVIYFERDYLPGIPTDQLPERKLEDPRYALALAGLMGKAAAPNLVVGRTERMRNDEERGEPLFDNGDEIIVEDSGGLPMDIVLVDHGGAFSDWRTPTLIPFAKSYAAPVNRRVDKVPDPKAFAEAYLSGLRNELARMQSDYRRFRKGFDGLFKHLPYDAEGNFACRWEHVLRRLETTDLKTLISEVSQHIAVLPSGEIGYLP